MLVLVLVVVLLLALASERSGEDWVVAVVVSVSDETHECERDSATTEEEAMPADAAELPSCSRINRKLELEPPRLRLRLRLRVPTPSSSRATLFLSMRIPDDTASLLPFPFPLLARVRVGVSLLLSLLWMCTLGEGVSGEWTRHASRGSHRNGGLGGELRLNHPSGPPACTDDDDDDEDERDASIATLMSVLSFSSSFSVRGSSMAAPSAPSSTRTPDGTARLCLDGWIDRYSSSSFCVLLCSGYANE